MKIQTQETKIRKHLEAGKTITPLQALSLFGCFRLASRISNLRLNCGMDIDKRMISRNGKHYAQYFIANNKTT